MSVSQIWLSAAGCSMRGVRYKQLSPAEVDNAASIAALGGASMTLISYQSAYQKEGIKMMLVSYTEPLHPHQPPPDKNGHLPPIQEPDLDKANWVKVDHTKLEVGGGLGDIFNAKDVSILSKIFIRNHESSAAEVDSIMGKAKTVQ